MFTFGEFEQHWNSGFRKVMVHMNDFDWLL